MFAAYQAQEFAETIFSGEKPIKEWTGNKF